MLVTLQCLVVMRVANVEVVCATCGNLVDNLFSFHQEPEFSGIEFVSASDGTKERRKHWIGHRKRVVIVDSFENANSSYMRQEIKRRHTRTYTILSRSDFE